ncbi:prolipoprotein diacylglyceryl transferase [Spiroplasma gladiatoris]|uniref:Prolipoprotein diacylglyceryl transferase n=1 Tax=Spiroplasma gladiatoris TaxID=2143 RepID=A0A4P7AHZ5_9MOLU|nr:prolipoprotein diacylglyceryl transferase [Spiroplasma gladiatoris]QBQ07293.1 prolipoprotein diacylglyceryl transferase [Spiroplasma gladiatoris]
MENWEDSLFRPDESRWTIKSDYLGDFLHMYAFFMTCGVLAAILLAYYQLRRRNLPPWEMLIASTVIVPSGLFGGSFFGKINASGNDWLNGESFFKLFAFWEAGMSIHGAILGGAIAALIMMYFLGRKPRISLLTYGDCIAPGILISQAIGRWGNFFNHELFGRPLGLYDQVNMPSWLKDNMTYIYNGPSNNVINGVGLQNGQSYVMQPLFLYESVGFLIVYLMIVLIIPGIGKWISKKPWKLHPNEFNLSWKNSWIHAFTWDKKIKNTTYFGIWNKAYFEKVEVDQVDWYEEEKRKITTTNKLKRKWQEGKLLDKANNPDGYIMARCGVQLGAYFLAWNAIRFYVETNRSQEGLFIMHNSELSLTIIGLTGLIGVLIMYLSQFVFPYLLRTPGFFYEKPYFYTKEVLEKINKKIEDNKAKKLIKTKINSDKQKMIQEKLNKAREESLKNKDSKK